MNLIKNMKISRVRSQIGATTFYSSGPAIDMAGYEGCLFIAMGSSLLKASSSPFARLQVQGSTVGSTGTWHTYSGSVSSTKPITGSLDHKLLIADVYRQTQYRYLRAKLTCATSSDVQFDGILAIQYEPKVAGSSNLWDSTTIAASTLMAMPTT